MEVFRNLRLMKKTPFAISLNCLFLAGCQEDSHRPVTTKKWSFLDTIKNSLPSDFSLSRLRHQVQSGDLALASCSINKAILVHPRCAPLHVLNGFVYEEMAKAGHIENVEMARTAYQKAIEIDPNQWAYAYILGVFELKQKNYLCAQGAFSEAVILRPGQWDLLYQLAHASYYVGDFPVALRCIEKALQLCPNNPMVQRTAAIIFAAAGQCEKAQKAQQAYGRLTKGKCRDQAWISKRMEDWKQVHAQARQDPKKDEDKPEADDDQPSVVMDCYLINVINRTSAIRGINVLKNVVLHNNSSPDANRAGLIKSLNWSHTQTQVIGNTNPPVTPSNTWTKISKTNLALGMLLTNNTSGSTSTSLSSISYGLNIANSEGDNFEILARPTLSTVIGKTVEFMGAEVVSVQAGTRFNVEAGIKILLRPIKINPDGEMTIQVDFTQSGFGATPDVRQNLNNQILLVRKAQTQTMVRAYPGQTVLVAGIQTTTRTRTKDGIMGLMDIPLVQYLTSNDQAIAEKRILLFCLTPRLGGMPVEKNVSSNICKGSPAAQKLAGFGLDSLVEYRNLYYILKHLSTSPLLCQFQMGDINPVWWGYANESIDKKLDQLNHFLYF